MRRALAAVALAALAAAVFAPAVGYEFVNFDDDRYVTENPWVQRGFTAESLRWAWTTGHMGNWNPVTWMSHFADWRLFGADPAGHHAVSIALHAANTGLVFILLATATGAPWRSALVAALFAVHPTRVESVAWVSERKDVLSTFFWLLTLLAYVGWTRRATGGRWALVLVLFALGLASKPMLVTLPATLALLDRWPLGRLRSAADLRPRVREKLSLVPLVVAACVVAVWAQRSAGALESLDAYPLGVRAANAVVAWATYLWMAVWPADLAVLYPHPGRVEAGRLAAAAAVLVALTALALRERERRPYLLVGWLWYVGTLVPVIGLVQLGGAALADRYTYVPYLGLFAALAWSLPPWPRLVPAAALGVLAALALATRAQLATWRDSVALWERALAVTERNPVAHNNLGFALARRGDTDAAMRHLVQAIALRPTYLVARVELGNLLLAAGRLDEATAQYQAAVAIDPTSAAALTNLGRALAQQGHPAEAVALHERALAADPSATAARLNLGTALAALGRFADARRAFEAVLAAEPENTDALNNRGNMLLAEGRTAEGLASIERALALRPDFGTAHGNRAAALLLLGRPAEAWEAVARARANGYEPPPALLRMLEERMPAPAGGTR